MLSTRPPYLRMLRIHERLSGGDVVSLAAFSESLEVSDRTVKRDLEYMRDQYTAPIEWDREKRGYWYTRPFDKLPAVRLSAEEAVAIVLASKVFSAWSESSLGSALEAALEKLSARIDDVVSISSEELDGLIVAPPEDEGRARERELLGVLIEAASDHHEIEIIYKKPHSDQERRRARPLHLARLQGEWTLIAFDCSRQAIRKFLLSRMSSIQVGDKTFERPEDFDPEAYLSGSVGRHTGDDRFAVVIEFDSFAAPYVREEHWRPARRVETLADGGIRVNMTLNNLIDIRRYVLSWGRHARVIEPVELRSAVQEEIEAMTRMEVHE